MMGDLECVATAPSESRRRKVERYLLDSIVIIRSDGSVCLCCGLLVFFER